MLINNNFNPSSTQLLFGWRVYSLDHPHEAEQFALMFDGIARAGKDSKGQWLAFI